MATPQEYKVLLGEAAEHLVLARILRRRLTASQAPRGWKADDILVVNGLRIQVKATDGGTRQGWMVGNVEPSPQRFYAFVDYANEAAPHVYIVPSCIVRDAAEKANDEGLRASPSAKPTKMRKIQDPLRVPVNGYPKGWLEQYREAWDQLTQVPALTQP